MKYLYWTIGILSIFLYGCSSDDPTPMAQDKWLVEYQASGISVNPECINDYLRWCQENEEIMTYSIPARNMPSFSYESTLIIKWLEYVNTEEEAKFKTESFNTLIGKAYNSTLGASYRKFNPQFTGPWRIVYLESFSYIHSNSEDFNKWYDENIQNMIDASFLVSEPNYHWEYPSPQAASDFYGKSICGTLQWSVVIPKASEHELQELTKRFQSFSIIGKTKNQYDTFVADYGPVTSSKTFP